MPKWVYPIAWPAGRSRTVFPMTAKFHSDGQAVSFDVGRDRMLGQLERLGADEIQISMNIRFTALGKRDMNISRTDPADRGVAIAFELNGQRIDLACDRWDRIPDNMAAIAAHIDALRGQERWGCGDIKTAFAGHIALPNFSARQHWTKVLELRVSASKADIEAAWRAKQREAKNEAEQLDINIARDEALEQRGFAK